MPLGDSSKKEEAQAIRATADEYRIVFTFGFLMIIPKVPKKQRTKSMSKKQKYGLKRTLPPSSEFLRTYGMYLGRYMHTHIQLYNHLLLFIFMPLFLRCSCLHHPTLLYKHTNIHAHPPTETLEGGISSVPLFRHGCFHLPRAM
jgi:hypothetical protein